ncbi:MAG TPA: hypothetical protein VGC74_07830 [Stenotrophomonas sp.]|jgi:hypothetical protein
MRKGIQLAAALLLLLTAGAAMATSRSQARALTDTQALYAAAVRWNDFDGAGEMVDPAYRLAHPQTDLERARYEQVQISGYRELRANSSVEGEVEREVEFRVVNRNTQAERIVRARETWHWDPEAKHWWLASGLPDLWKGE